jgi:nucleoside-triphosphatase
MKLLEKLPARTAGFYTEEIKEHGTRKGFSLISLSGQRSILSHVDFKGPRRVGKYKVDIEGFNRFLEGINFDEADVVVVDEIGKMEAMSTSFRELITNLMASGKTVIATIALKGDSFKPLVLYQFLDDADKFARGGRQLRKHCRGARLA